MSGLFGGGGSSMKTLPAQNPSKKAEPITIYKDGTDKQKKLSASLVTKDWEDPTLAKKGLTGL